MSSSTVEIKQTSFYVYIYLLIIPKKKKNYKVLELGELEYLRKKKKKTAFYYKMVFEPGILEYCVAWYLSLPCSSTT